MPIVWHLLYSYRRQMSPEIDSLKACSAQWAYSVGGGGGGGEDCES